MTRNEDPGLWWHRKLQWMMAGTVTIGLSVLGYIAVKWDKSADAVIIMSTNIANMSDDIKDMRDDGKQTKEDIKAVRKDFSDLKTTTDARLNELEKSEWWAKFIGKRHEDNEKEEKPEP